jgi:hypothetical protein
MRRVMLGKNGREKTRLKKKCRQRTAEEERLRRNDWRGMIGNK